MKFFHPWLRVWSASWGWTICQASVRSSVHLEYTRWLTEEGQSSGHKGSVLRSMSMIHCVFSARRPANHLYITIAAGPIPPVEEKTTEVPGPCSTCRILCWYAHLFLFSCCLYKDGREELPQLGVWGLNTLVSKIAIYCLSSQNPCAHISARAPSSTLAVLCCNCSPVSGCNVVSIEMLWHTSLSKFAVISLMRCLSVGNPPVGQLKACVMMNLFPQTQWVGR